MFASEKDFLKFDSDYKDCRERRGRHHREPSKADLTMFGLWKKGLTIGEIAAKHDVAYGTADRAITRVSRSHCGNDMTTLLTNY